MLKNISNLGIVLNKSQKQSINGSAASFCSREEILAGCVEAYRIRTCICVLDQKN